MSFDLSQLDRLAKGEAVDAQGNHSLRKSVTPRPSLRPQLGRRRSHQERRLRQLSLDIEEHSEGGPSQQSKFNNTGSFTPQKEASPDSESQAEEADIDVHERCGQKRKDRKEKEKGDLIPKKKSAKQERLEQLARLTDLTDLPLCDIISRATYLEDLSSHESQKRKTPPPSSPEQPRPNTTVSLLAPRVTVVDGRMVVNAASLETTNRKTTPSTEYVRVEETDDRIINYHSYADWTSTRPSKWSREETELLVQGIGQFGIDFALLQRLFPNRTRKQIKSKFSRIWKEDPLAFGHHFNKTEGEKECSYRKLLEDLRAEKRTDQDGE